MKLIFCFIQRYTIPAVKMLSSHVSCTIRLQSESLLKTMHVHLEVITGNMCFTKYHLCRFNILFLCI